jgi:hypothetical protein
MSASLITFFPSPRRERVEERGDIKWLKFRREKMGKLL